MKARSPFFALLLVGAVFIAGLVWLFQLRLSSGDVFPAYSTLRADPLGTRVLFEALAEIPGIQVERSLKPIDQLPNSSRETVLFCGMSRGQWETLPTKSADAIDAMVRAGSRVIVVFSAHIARLETEPPIFEPVEKAPKKSPKPADSSEQKASRGPGSKESDPTLSEKSADWKILWGLETKIRLIMDQEKGATLEPGAPGGLPHRQPWKSDLYFERQLGSSWQVVYTRGRSPVVMEMHLGRGSVVIASDAYFISNEALQRNRSAAFLAWVIGPNQHIVFSEAHLGLTENTGIAALGRRYGLSGAFFCLVVLALLYVWQKATPFVPTSRRSRDIVLTYDPTAGLEALLRRALPANKIVQTCFTEWARSASKNDVEKVSAALAAQPAGTPPGLVYNAAVAALKKRNS